MNVVIRVQPSSDAAEIAHSILAYDRRSQDLSLELPIPLFLDTLALKIAKVPSDDKYGVSSYALDSGATNVFRFLLGLELNQRQMEYFLEPTAGHVTNFGSSKLAALNLFSQVTPRPRYARAKKPRISERELVLPTLRLLETDSRGWMATSDIIAGLTKLFAPSGQDAEIIHGRKDTYFSQKVRNMISHRDQASSFIRRNLASYEDGGLRISDEGRSTVRALLS